MKYPTLMGAMLMLALLLVACGPATTGTPTEMIEPTTEITEPAATEPATTEPSVTKTTEATEPAATDTATTDTTATPGVPVTGAATVMVAEVGTFGEALVDG